MFKKKNAAKKVFCRPVAIDWGRRTSALPNLSNRERVNDKTSDWALASRAHFRGAYLFGLLAFVLFSHMFTSLMLSFDFFPARPLTVYKHFVFFWSSEKKKKKKSATQKESKPWECWKKKKKRTNASIFLKKKVQHNTSERRYIVLLSELWDWTVLSCSV